MSTSPANRPAALVTGGTGVLGPGLVDQLVAAGWRVRVLARHAPATDSLPDTVELVRGDITDADAVRAAVQGTTHVFHLAAKLHINNPDPALSALYRAVNVEGTRVLAEAALEADVARLVYFSTIAVYGPTRPGEVLDEEGPVRAATLYGSTKKEAEDVVRSLRGRNDRPIGVVLRLAAVYGGRVRGNYRELVRYIRRGLFVPVGRGENRRTLVHEIDVARAALLAATHPAAAGRIFNVTDGQIYTLRDIIEAISEGLDRRSPRLYVPVRAARACAGVLDAGLALGGRRRIAGPLVEKLIEDMAVSGRRIHDELGFLPRFSLRDGWAEAIPRIIGGDSTLTGSKHR